MNTENLWKQSEFQTTTDEWLIKKNSENQFEFVEFQPYKDKDYNQFGGEITHYKVDLTNFTENQVIEALSPFGLSLGDEETSNETIAQCLCEQWRSPGVVVKERWSDTIDGLNAIFKELNINF